MAIGCVNIPAQSRRRTLNKAISTFIAAGAALALSGGANAQNNTLATPSVVSPVAAAANATNGYGTPGAGNSDSGTSAGSSNAGAPKSANTSSAVNSTAYGVNNTLATPSTASPVK
jgi:hypothetical protein